MKKVNLVIGGSGTLFPVYIGAIRRLEEEKYSINKIVAVSGGSIIGMLLAMGKNSYDIERIVKSFNFSEFKDININFFNRYGLIKGDKILEAFNKHFPSSMKELEKELSIVILNWSKQQTVIHDNFSPYTPSQLIRASMSIPIAFKYVKLGEDICVDGGTLNNYPIDYFNNEENVIGLKVIGEIYTPVKNQWINPIDYLMSFVSIWIDQLEKKHMEDAQYAKTIHIKTNQNNLNFNFTNKDIDEMILDGYNATHKFLTT